MPQPGADRKLDAQGDKIMARLVYRRIGNQQSIVGVHSVEYRRPAAAACAGMSSGSMATATSNCISRAPTHLPGFRWMASPAMDKLGNIGIGYSFGAATHFAGQRFAARLAERSAGQLTLREAMLVEGEAAQTTTLRWQDYTQTAIDPSDDCTIWYVGDYMKKGAATYSTHIGAFQLPGCAP